MSQVEGNSNGDGEADALSKKIPEEREIIRAIEENINSERLRFEQWMDEQRAQLSKRKSHLLEIETSLAGARIARIELEEKSPPTRDLSITDPSRDDALKPQVLPKPVRLFKAVTDPRNSNPGDRLTGLPCTIRSHGEAFYLLSCFDCGGNATFALQDFLDGAESFVSHAEHSHPEEFLKRGVDTSNPLEVLSYVHKFCLGPRITPRQLFSIVNYKRGGRPMKVRCIRPVDHISDASLGTGQGNKPWPWHNWHATLLPQCKSIVQLEDGSWYWLCCPRCESNVYPSMTFITGPDGYLEHLRKAHDEDLLQTEAGVEGGKNMEIVYRRVIEYCKAGIVSPDDLQTIKSTRIESALAQLYGRGQNRYSPQGSRKKKRKIREIAEREGC
ncbi:MAG: hypothetical protein M1820_001752 [Bogoriella megaspora]|nr:MAG: hypothetical protein M1820_001752 [Bogoriella megaspora]